MTGVKTQKKYFQEDIKLLSCFPDLHHESMFSFMRNIFLSYFKNSHNLWNTFSSVNIHCNENNCFILPRTTKKNPCNLKRFSFTLNTIINLNIHTLNSFRSFNLKALAYQIQFYIIISYVQNSNSQMLTRI